MTTEEDAIPTSDHIEMPTRIDVDSLKSSWLQSPTWALEDTAGFELYHGELLTFRIENKAKAMRQKRALEASTAILGLGISASDSQIIMDAIAKGMIPGVMLSY